MKTLLESLYGPAELSPNLAELTKSEVVSKAKLELSNSELSPNLAELSPNLAELGETPGLSKAKLNGAKGGRSRALRLSPERRREIALLGVEARRKKKAKKAEIGFHYDLQHD